MTFKCDQCNESCSTKGNLKRHKINCHKERPMFDRI